MVPVGFLAFIIAKNMCQKKTTEKWITKVITSNAGNICKYYHLGFLFSLIRNNKVITLNTGNICKQYHLDFLFQLIRNTLTKTNEHFGDWNLKVDQRKVLLLFIKRT